MSIRTIRIQPMLKRSVLVSVTAAVALTAMPLASQAQAPAAAANPALPSWAYPVNPPFPEWDTKVLHRVPGSTKEFTQAQVENDFAPPDWHPEDHPELPAVVSHGRPPAVRACMKCHLTNGAGHPGSSDLAGMSVAYLTEQMHAFRDGNRTGQRAAPMIPIAKAITDEEILEASRYFSALPPPPDGWRTIKEGDTVPETFVHTGGMRLPVPGGRMEKLGNRIIELPQDVERVELRDSRAGFQSTAPKGSFKKGEKLVKDTSGKTIACATCHGPDLNGLADVPGLLGRSPLYIFRQLNDIKIGARKGGTVALMQPVVANLSEDEMLAIAAYLTSQKPKRRT